MEQLGILWRMRRMVGLGSMGPIGALFEEGADLKEEEVEQSGDMDTIDESVDQLVTTSVKAGTETKRRRRKSGGNHVLAYLRSVSREGRASKELKRNVIESFEWWAVKSLDEGTYAELGSSPDMVRSTISLAFSCDGTLFASTHGDHSVKVLTYPGAKMVASLEAHPRTPWTVRFHPTNPKILASGCLGHLCCIWNVDLKQRLREHFFDESISCVSFHPSGDFLAITSGKLLYIWEWTIEGSAPVLLVEQTSPLLMVDFHPSGTLLMAGKKNSQRQAMMGAQFIQFTLKVMIYLFDLKSRTIDELPLFVVPRVVAYNEAGVHFSSDGKMLAACVAVAPNDDEFQLAVLSLEANGSSCKRMGDVLFTTPIDPSHAMALTNLKFSSTGSLLLAGFSFQPDNPVLRFHVERCEAISRTSPARVSVVDVYRMWMGSLHVVKSLLADVNIAGAEDQINAAVFAPGAGFSNGLLYGTQCGRIRIFQSTQGRGISTTDEDEVMDSGEHCEEEQKNWIYVGGAQWYSNLPLSD